MKKNKLKPAMLKTILKISKIQKKYNSTVASQICFNFSFENKF
jgi:hypothetical protein